MTALEDFVALSLLPPWCWLRAADPLRAGEHPAFLVRRLIADHWPDEPEKLGAADEEAQAAVQLLANKPAPELKI